MIQMPIFYRLLFLLTISLPLTINAQSDIIYLENPSFEDEPRAGWQPNGWIDCGFPGESAPDVQPYGGFGVTQSAQNQNTYLGLVVRDNKTWECVSQRLRHPLKKDQCYKFSIYLSRSAQYVSPTKREPNRLTNFEQGVVLRVYGGNGPRDRAEMLYSTDVINHTEWKQYKLEFTPKNNDYQYFFLEAYYKTPTMFYYNGNLLLDNASEIYSCNIPDPDTEVVVKNDNNNTNVKPKDPKDPKVDPFKEENKNEEVVEEDRGNFDPKMKAKDLKVGYTFRLENLYFQADSANITNNAERVLTELVNFLKDNPEVSIEVGGHTNGLPAHEYCDRLSSARAKNVARFLTLNGIDRRRITHKGYGKRKPIADNDTDQGKRLNQRVEVKITDLE
jgi:outer membrane protein OmpA-like peptidoglycan-associated protein